MKKTLLFKSIALSLFMLFGIGVVNAQNLLLNGSMESWENTTTPTSWTHVENITQESTIIHGGTYSAKHIGGTKDLGQTIVVKPNTDYTIVIWYYVAAGDGTDARIWSFFQDASNVRLDDIPALLGPDNSYFPSEASWQKYETTVTSPATAAKLYFELRTYSTATVYYDDMSVTEATTPFVATDLIFSEYNEGSASNRAIEIFNGTGADVDLSVYSVKQSYGGQGWGIRDGVEMIQYILPLTGTLANGDVFIFYNADAIDATILAEGDLALTYGDNTAGCRVAAFTGDDALGLFKADVLIDVIGNPAVDPGNGWDVAGVTEATVNHTLIRKSDITQGNTDWAASAGTNTSNSEWVVYDVDYFVNLGIHTFEEIVDVTPPSFTTDPADAATDVLINASIVLTFDEAIRNIDDSEITNANVAELLTLKVTDASGADVAFTASIDAEKKVIVLTPVAYLANSQVYYAAIAPVEDVLDNATTLSSMTFTTISASSPAIYNVDIAEAGPYYAGDVVTITWESANVTDVTIDAWTTDFSEWYKMFETTPSDGSETFTIPADAYSGTGYFIRISDLADSANVFGVSVMFEIIATPSIYDIQSNMSSGDITEYFGQKVRTSGIVTAIKGGEFWIQEAAGALDYPAWSGILAYDFTVGGTLTVGDDVTLFGTATEYNGLTEIATITNAIINSAGNSIEAVGILFADATEAYESTLITLFGEVKTAPDANGEFLINDGTLDYIIDDKLYAYTPTIGDMVNVTGIVGYASATSLFKLYPRTAADVVVSTLGLRDLTAVEMSIYPNPSNGKFFVEMGSAFKANTKIEVFNVVGMKVFETMAFDFKTEINLNSMKQGVYYVRVDDGKNIVTRKLIKQ